MVSKASRNTAGRFFYKRSGYTVRFLSIAWRVASCVPVLSG